MNRIIIETDKQIYEGMIKPELAQMISKKIQLTETFNYIIVTDVQNENSAAISVHGNAEKLAKMIDAFMHYTNIHMPAVIDRVLIAWEKRMKQ